MTTGTQVYDPASKQTTVAPGAPPSAALAKTAPSEIVRLGMDTVQGFEALQRAARLLCASSLVPERYRGAEGLPNAVIALEMATRIGASPLMAMQHLYVVHGQPGWSAQFLIASVNSCGRFTALRYEWTGKKGQDAWGCRAWTIEKETGQRLDGSWVTWEQVKSQGWLSKNGSKWQSMPEQMFMYRSAAYWQRAYAPEVGMGLRTTEELEDSIVDVPAFDAVTIPNAAPSLAADESGDAAPTPSEHEQPASEPTAGAAPEPPKKGAAAVKAAIRKDAAAPADPLPQSGERKAPTETSERTVRPGQQTLGRGRGDF
jgi:hypothetical protein